jgi:hypothetical protein
VQRRFPEILSRFVFLICMVIGEQGCSQFWCLWRTRLSSDFGDIVLAGRVGFALRISDDNKITELKLCHMCIDDSSLIFVFPLHMFSV